MKNQTLVSEPAKEHNCTSGFDKNVKPQEAQGGRSLLMPQAQRCGKSPFAEEGQGSSGKTRKCLAQEMPVFGVDDPEAECKLSNAIIGPDQSPKGNCVNSSSCQGVSQSVMQTAGCAIKEINSAENGLARNMHFEKNPSEECVEKLSLLLLKPEVDAGGEGLSPASQAEEEAQTLGLELQQISEKGDGTVCLAHREEFCSPNQEIPERTNTFVQNEAKMRNNKQDQLETCNKEAKN